MLEYNNEIKRLTATFKAFRNDIDIFTEDEDKDREFYNILFQRLLKDTGLKINDITPLGCRRNVINACNTEPDNNRKKIFIIDGDIYLVNGDDEIEENENLFILNSYCIENFILDETAAVELGHFLIGTKSKDEVKNDLSYVKWLEDHSSILIDLFFHFSILNEVTGVFELFNAHRFKDGFGLNCDRIKELLVDIKQQIMLNVDTPTYELKLKDREDKWPKTIETLLKIVSGKSYLLPMLQFRLEEFRKVKGILPNECVKTFLAQHCSLESLEDLKNRLISAN